MALAKVILGLSMDNKKIEQKKHKSIMICSDGFLHKFVFLTLIFFHCINSLIFMFLCYKDI